MEKIDFTKEVDACIKKIIDEKLVRHTCQFFRKGEKGLKPFGSGIFALIHGTHFILTASHVAAALEGDNELFVQVNEKRYINVV